MTGRSVLASARSLVVGATWAALAGLAQPAEAACTVSVTSVSFGSYDVYASSPAVATGTVTYNCGATDRNIRVTLSTGSSGTFAPRTLVSGSDGLDYNLYRDAALTTVWGDGSGGTVVYTRANPPNGRDVVLTIYGRILALQDAAAGSYTDTVVAAIDF